MEYNEIEPRRRNKMLTDFETMIKWSFQASYDRKMIVDLIGVADNKEKGIEDSSIILYPYVFSNNTPISYPTQPHSHRRTGSRNPNPPTEKL